MFLKFLICCNINANFVYRNQLYHATSRLAYYHYYQGWYVPVFQVMVNGRVYLSTAIKNILDRLTAQVMNLTIQVSDRVYNTRESVTSQNICKWST